MVVHQQIFIGSFFEMHFFFSNIETLNMTTSLRNKVMKKKLGNTSESVTTYWEKKSQHSANLMVNKICTCDLYPDPMTLPITNII